MALKQLQSLLYVFLSYDEIGVNDRFSEYKRLLTDQAKAVESYIADIAESATELLLGYTRKERYISSKYSEMYQKEKHLYTQMKEKGGLKAHSGERQKQATYIFEKMEDYVRVFFVPSDASLGDFSLLGNVWIKTNETDLARFERIQSGFVYLLFSIVKRIVTGKLHQKTSDEMDEELQKKRKEALTDITQASIASELERMQIARIDKEQVSLFRFDMQVFHTLYDLFGYEVVHPAFVMLREIFVKAVIYTGLITVDKEIRDIYKDWNGFLSPVAVILHAINQRVTETKGLAELIKVHQQYGEFSVFIQPPKPVSSTPSYIS